MERVLRYVITEADEGLRIEQYLKQRGYSRQCLIHLKKHPGSVLADGVSRFLNQPLAAGERLIIRFCEEESSAKIPPVEIPLNIVYEDEDLLVINKPAGMPIHPSMNNYTNSMANGLAWYYAQQGKPFIFRCINRLDRDTSGLTLVAKNLLSSCILSAMAQKKAIRREYLAIVRGSVRPGEGTIDAPLIRKPGSIIEREVDFAHGETAVTHYRLEKESNGHSLIALRLETGRTHQIRVHMKYIGYPLIGDYLYNPDTEWIGRQALHSCRLSFVHPITGEAMDFSAPLPEDMDRVLNGGYGAGVERRIWSGS